MAAQYECLDHVEVEWSLHLAVVGDEISKCAYGRIRRTHIAFRQQVSCLFFQFQFALGDPGGESWGFLGGVALAFRDLSPLTTRFQPPTVGVFYT
jgi:hypothetical protein